MPKFYIYKITFDDGSTYVGSHIEYKENDGYVCSSRYYARHPELKVVSREKMYLDTLEQMNIMETIAIMDDKCYSPKNINGNYGNWLYNFHSKLDCPWNKGLKMGSEFGKNISDKESEPLLCIETMEVLKNTQENGHYSEVSLGKRKTVNGRHYRKMEEEEVRLLMSGDDSLSRKLNAAFLAELYADETFYYCKEYDIAFETLDMIARMLSVNPADLKSHFGECYFGFTIVPISGGACYGNGIKVIRKLSNPKKNVKKIMCVETGEIFDCLSDVLKKYKGHIGSAAKGKRKTACGYHWKYCE